MKHTIVVCGHGPGISDAVARRFGREGWNVAIVARNAERLDKAAAALTEAGVAAKAFPCDLGDAAAVKSTLKSVASSLGPPSAIQYNAYGGGGGDLLSLSADDLQLALRINACGLLAAVQEALPSLKAAKGAVLVTGGGFAYYEPEIDAMANNFGAAGLALGKAAQHKLTGLLASRLEQEGVYVGEVVVMGMVKGTAFDSGQATLEASDIAERFWQLYQKRDARTVNFP